MKSTDALLSTAPERAALTHVTEEKNAMKILTTTALAVAITAAGALSAAADTLSLDAWAARHFNAGVSVQDRQVVPSAVPMTFAARGVDAGPSLSEAAAVRFNAGVSVQDRQAVTPPRAFPDPALDAAAVRRFNTGVSVQDAQS